MLLSLVATAITTLSDSSSAETYSDMGGCTYSYTPGDETAIVTGYVESVKDVKILSKITVDEVDYTVTSIAADVFKGKALESLVIEEGVTAIPASEFEGCTALKTVSIPLSVTTVGDAAFKGCTALESVTIAVSDQSAAGSRVFGASVFEDCSSLKTVTADPSLKLGNACFKNSGLESFTLYLAMFGAGPMAVINQAELFMGCSNLSSLKVDYGSKTMIQFAGQNMFKDCTALKSFPFPEDGTVQMFAFPAAGVFENSAIESVHIKLGSSPGNAMFMGAGIFKDCKSLKTVNIESTTVVNSADLFKGCSLDYVYMQMNSVNLNALVDCSIDTLKLPKGTYIDITDDKKSKLDINTVDLGMFTAESNAGMDSDAKNIAKILSIPTLKKIIQTEDNPRYSLIDSAVYRLDYFSETDPTLPVELILCSPDIASLEIPETVTAIGANAFDGCKVLKLVSFPESVATYSYAGSDVSFKDASGTAVGSDVENFAGRTYMVKDGIDGLALCPVLTFIADDKEVGKVTYTWDGKAVVPEVPAKTGFTGVWEDYPAVTEDKEIKAIYTPNKHTVTYMVNGTQFGDAETYDFGTEVIVKADYQKDGYESTSWSAEGIKVTDGKFVLGDADVVFTATSVMIVSAGTDGAAEIVLPVGETTFKPSEGTKTVTVKMAENTSVEIADAADLVGKVVVSKVKEITSTSGISGKAYEFTFTADGTQYNGKMEVTLPYTKENGKVPVVYFWDGSKSTEMKVLSSTDTSVTFETDHNSEYIVASESPSKEDGLNIILYMGILIVIGFAIAMLVGFNFYRRKA